MKSTSLVAGAIAVALASTLVLAQPYGGYGPRGGMWGGGPGMMGGGPGAGMWGGPQNVQERLDARKAALKITAEQEPLWNAYAALVAEQAQAMIARHEAMWSSPPATSADRLALHSEFMGQQAQQQAKMSDAYGKLYAALSAEQRAIADQGFGFGPGAGYGKRGPGPGGWR